MIKCFDINLKGTDYVVGDIHANFRKLQRQLDEEGFDPAKDRLFSVGDLVDRGPDHDLLEEWLDYPWFHAVVGNHEMMIINEEYDLSLMNGGRWFYELDEQSKNRIRFKLSQLPLGIEVITGGGAVVGIVHADVCCTVSAYNPTWQQFKESPNKADTVWSRDRIRYVDTTVVGGIDRVYVGHTPTSPKMIGNVIYLDNGAWSRDINFNIQKLWLDCLTS